MLSSQKLQFNRPDPDFPFKLALEGRPCLGAPISFTATLRNVSRRSLIVYPDAITRQTDERAIDRASVGPLRLPENHQSFSDPISASIAKPKTVRLSPGAELSIPIVLNDEKIYHSAGKYSLQANYIAYDGKVDASSNVVQYELTRCEQ